MQSATLRRSVVRSIGVIVLLAGLSVGGFMYWRSLQSDSEAADEEAMAALEDSRAYQQAVKRNVGAVGLLMDQWSEWAEKLGEPRPLAITIMVVSSLVAGGCFLAASRMSAAQATEKSS